MKDALEELKKLTETVLTETDNDELLRSAIRDMQAIYTQHTGIKADTFSEEGITTPWGLAISPYQAADCLPEMERTVVFLRGIYKAILRAKESHPGERINIVYAGCGPYAALLTPFATIFSAAEVGYYLLDISSESLESVKRMYGSMGIEDHVTEYVCCDAAAYELPKDVPVHIVISETMQKSLRQEPQVAIMLNLVPQMAPDAIFIPEEIRVSVRLLNDEDNTKDFFIGKFDPEHIDLGTIYTIGRRQCAPHTPVTLTMPAAPGIYTRLNLFTHLTVFEDEKFVPWQCSLSLPVFVDEIATKPGGVIRFRYEHGSAPEFKYEWVG